MPEYRRCYVPGGSFFFTLVTYDRARFLCDAVARQCLREAITETRDRWPFAIDAFVLLPDHLHTIWTLPETDTDYSTRWAYLKKTFTQLWLKRGGRDSRVSASRRRNRRKGVWQRRFWEHTIHDEHDWHRHCDYIHYNPVRHGLTECPHAWPYSSFRRVVNENLYAEDWACACHGNSRPALRFDDIKKTAVE